jgi:hypothetical protein
LGAFSYQWLRGGVAIGGATASTYTLGDADVGSQISVQVSYTDGQGTAEGPLTSSQTAAVTNVNDAPIGVPTITGTVEENQILSANTAGISDADGLGAFSYQWLRGGVAIGGATASTYTLGDADVGTQISVEVSYTDGYGTAEGPLTSAQTVAVAAVNDAPSAAIVPANYAATEQVSLTLHGTGLSIGDIDAGGANVTATVSVVSGTLSAAAGTTGVGIAGSGSASVTLTGTVTQINNLLAGSLGSTLTYSMNSNTPPASDTLTLQVNDGGNTGSGGPLIASDNATINITAVNDPPVGIPTITGTVTEDQILSADTSGISDADGLGAFSYQWLRGGVAIGGATASTYTLGDADVGAQMSVRVSYVDAYGMPEGPLTSAQTAAVANVNDAPVGVPTITGTVTEDQVLTADTSGISDADGLGAFSYQWLRGGVAIGGATAGTYTLGDADVGSQISVQVSYTDGQGTAESVTSAQTAAVTNVNDAPVGVPTITGTVTEDQVLTADTSGVSDADGLGAFSYQWLRGGVAIGGATASTYTLGDADVGSQISVEVSYRPPQSRTSTMPRSVFPRLPAPLPKTRYSLRIPAASPMLTASVHSATSGCVAVWPSVEPQHQISVQVGYTDGQGTGESVTSAQTAPVTNINDAPVGLPTITGTVTEDQVLTADTSGISDADGLGAFSYQWLRGGAPPHRPTR